MEEYKDVAIKEEEETAKCDRFNRDNRKKYANIFPPYFPQVMAVITGKKNVQIKLSILPNCLVS